jgi:hypothetical protein
VRGTSPAPPCSASAHPMSPAGGLPTCSCSISCHPVTDANSKLRKARTGCTMKWEETDKRISSGVRAKSTSRVRLGVGDGGRWFADARAPVPRNCCYWPTAHRVTRHQGWKSRTHLYVLAAGAGLQSTL